MEIDPKFLAAQLRKPEGEFGIKLAEELNKSNLSITHFAYDNIPIETYNTILEIGPGNGVLMQELLEREPSLTLHGIDFSEDMMQLASTLNKEQIANGKMHFQTAGVSAIPYDENTFDHVCTINTLYFWPNPITDAKEVYRVLKPEGSFTIAIRPKKDAEALEATKHGFKLYEEEEVEELLLEAGFTNITTSIHYDPPFEFDGKTYDFRSLIIVAFK